MFRSFLMSRKGLRTVALAAVVGLAFAPVTADARAGGGGSFGSRGGRTFAAPPTTPTAPRAATPIERSTTPSTMQSGAPGRAAAPASSGIGRGFIGGLIGAGLLGALFGAGFFGGLGSLMSILGLILQIGLLVIVARLAFNWFTRRKQQPAMAAAGMAPPGARPYEGPAARMGATAASSSRPSVAPTIGPDDFNAFERSLVLIQQASTNEDVASLRNLVTPDMVPIFQEEIAEYARKGVANRTGGTTLLQGDLAEAWSEGAVEYASVAMRFSMTDTMVDRATGKLISGDPRAPVEATEIWTFQRPSSGKPDSSRLGAIQQAN